MQQDFTELTIAAVNSFYGELSSQVYACLAYAGRHTLHDIVRFTKFSSRQVGASLVVLVQHLLVKHYTTDLGQTLYEADGEAAYNAVFRTPKLVQAVGRLYGLHASSVVQEIALRGHATVDQIRDALCPSTQESPRLNGTKRKRNGEMIDREASHKPASVISQNELDDIVRHLLGLGYLIQVTTSRFLPEEDLINEAKAVVLREDFSKGLGTAKEKQAFSLQQKRKLHTWRKGSYQYFGRHKSKRDSAITTGINGMNGTSHGGNMYLKGDIDITLNFEKCYVIMRNDQMANYVHRYMGETSSVVLRALLQALDNRSGRCFDECRRWDDLLQTSDVPWPSADSILRQIPAGVKVQSGLARPAHSNGINGHSSKVPVTIPSDDSDSGSDIETPRKASGKGTLKHSSASSIAINRHLQLLEQDPRGFVQRYKSGWVVPFTRITHLMIEYEIENTVGAQHGQLASRIIRILHKNQSNDEKGLAIAAVIKPKDVRQITNVLLSAGIITTQEIPRDTNRTTNRLLWLYAYSPEQARQQILNDCYRAMLRLLRRLAVEKAEYSGTIDKAERTDVVGHEDEYLNEKDRDILERWNKKEEVMLAQISRIDDLVACMRDFAPVNDLGDQQVELVLKDEDEED